MLDRGGTITSDSNFVWWRSSGSLNLSVCVIMHAYVSWDQLPYYVWNSHARDCEYYCLLRCDIIFFFFWQKFYWCFTGTLKVLPLKGLTGYIASHHKRQQGSWTPCFPCVYFNFSNSELLCMKFGMNCIPVENTQCCTF